MKELFVSYDLAMLLKEKGFNEDCICGFNKSGTLISKVSYSPGKDCECIWGRDDIGALRAPLYQQVVDWFRKKHNIHIWISSDFLETSSFRYTLHLETNGKRLFFFNEKEPTKDLMYQDYYEALIKTIKQALKLI